MWKTVTDINDFKKGSAITVASQVAMATTVENMVNANSSSDFGIISSEDYIAGEVGYLIFDKNLHNGQAQPLTIKLWNPTKLITHKVRQTFEDAINSFVAKDILMIMSSDPKRLELGFTALRGSCIERHSIHIRDFKVKSGSKSGKGGTFTDKLNDKLRNEI